MPDLLEITRKTIAEADLVPAGGKVLVAVSGGPDSVVLLHVLRRLGYEVAVVHCNFGLREAAREDEGFVRELAARLGVPLHVRSLDAKATATAEGISVQAAARKLRYACFDRLLTDEGYARCATAHHRDDQVEGLLLSFFRGRHPDLLHGIPIRRGPYIRPFLHAAKAAILAFAEAENIAFRIDESNASVKFDRNFVRHALLPVLREFNPSVEAALLQKYEEWKAQRAILEALFADWAKDCVTEDAEGAVVRLETLAEAVPGGETGPFIAWYLREKGWNANETAAALALRDAETGRVAEAAAGTVLKDRGDLHIRFRRAGRYSGEARLLIPEDFGAEAVLRLGKWIVRVRERAREAGEVPHGEPGVHVMDRDRVGFPLEVRRWRRGDRMQPLGMKGTKLLSDIFVDERYDRFAKAEALVFADDAQVVCLSGFRIAEGVKVRPDTRRILVIALEEAAEGKENDKGE